MASPFDGLEIGRRSLIAHQLALNVTGHNIANAANEDYSRQQVIFEATDPLYPPCLRPPYVPGKLGTGVMIRQIKRIRDLYVEDRLNQERGRLSYWETHSDKLHRLELIYNEPSESNIRTLLDRFWTSLQDLANNPEDISIRATVREKAANLCESLRHTYTQLQELREVADDEIKERIEQINSYAKRIAGMNIRILQAEGKGESPNDLLDKRDALIGELAELVGIRVVRTDKDDFKVTIGGEVLVQNGKYFTLGIRTQKDNYGFIEVYWKENGKTWTVENGKLKALLEVRDEAIPYHMKMWDDFVIALIDKFNERHRAGFTLTGKTNIDFFKPFVTETGGDIYKVSGNASGYVHLTNKVLNNPFDVLNENAQANTNINELDVTGCFEINGKIIHYDASKDSLEDIVKRINEANCGVLATINPYNRLTLSATALADFKITSLSDNPMRPDKGRIDGVEEVREGGAILDLNGDFSNTNFEHNITGSILVGPDHIDVSKPWVDAGFGAKLDGKISIGGSNTKGATFNLQDYRTVQEFMDAVNSNEDADAIITYDEKTDKFTIKRKTAGETLYLVETGRNGFLTQAKIRLPSTPTDEVISYEEVVKDNRFYISDYTTVKDLLAAVDLADDADAGLIYDSLTDRFYIERVSEGGNLNISEAQLASTGAVSDGSGINLDNPFATAGFDLPIDDTTTLTINGVEFGPLNGYASVQEFMDEVNSSSANVEIVYDKLNDRFNIISKERAKPVVVQQSGSNGFLYGAKLGFNDTNEHTCYGFFTGAKIPTGKTGGNLLEKLGILKQGKSFPNLESLADGADYVRVPQEGVGANIDLTDEILNDLNNIAAAKGIDNSVPLDGEPDVSLGTGNGENALELADIRDALILNSGTTTFSDFFETIITKAGIDAENAKLAEENKRSFVDNLKNLRQSISGVSLDEEMINLVRFQHGYEAAARVITVMDNVIRTTIALIR